MDGHIIGGRMTRTGTTRFRITSLLTDIHLWVPIGILILGIFFLMSLR